MDKDARWQQLHATFNGELVKRVDALNRLLLRLERDVSDERTRRELCDALFREVHSLKGAARVLDLGVVEQLAHALEGALEQARQSVTLMDGCWFAAVYQAVDLFHPLYQGTRDGTGTATQLSNVLAGLQHSEHGYSAQIQAVARVTKVSEADSETSVIAPQRVIADIIMPPADAPRRQDTTSMHSTTSDSVRVAVSKLDGLLAQAGELMVTHTRIEQRQRELRELRQGLDGWRREWRAQRGVRRSLRRGSRSTPNGSGGPTREWELLLQWCEQAEQRLETVVQQVEEITTQLRHDTAQLGQVTRAIEDDVMAVRLLPVGGIFGPLERMVRDLARAQAKDIQLLVSGNDTEIDRKILEQLRDPLMHMLRNAVDHGIESPMVRAAAGKSPAGTIRLRATHQGSTVVIELADDGAGLDPQRLRQSAVAKGLLSQGDAAALDDQAAVELIFQPGFSTSAAVTETSGRGVGMDVVRAHVEQLNGQIKTWSAPGHGTDFTITLPLTLATTRVILVEQGGHIFAIPSAMIERNARLQERQIVRLEGRRAVAIEGVPVPVVELAEVLVRPPGNLSDPDAWRAFFVLRQDDRRLALLVDRLVGEQEIVVKPLGWPLRRVRNVGGAAVLPSGQTVAILHPADLLKTGLKLSAEGSHSVARPPSAVPSPPRRRVLVVDDSLITRTLERSILEAAGYETEVAADGTEALSVLRRQPIDIVVSDIEMPRLDGFGLTAEIRRDEQLRQLPVVLVTSLEAQEHRERGVAVGADAYIVKSGFDQGQLLATIGRLL